MKNKFLLKDPEVKYTLRFKLLSLLLDFNLLALLYTYGDFVSAKRWLLLQVLCYIIAYWTKTGFFAKKEAASMASSKHKDF